MPICNTSEIAQHVISASRYPRVKWVTLRDSLTYFYETEHYANWQRNDTCKRWNKPLNIIRTTMYSVLLNQYIFLLNQYIFTGMIPVKIYWFNRTEYIVVRIILSGLFQRLQVSLRGHRTDRCREKTTDLQRQSSETATSRWMPYRRPETQSSAERRCTEEIHQRHDSMTGTFQQSLVHVRRAPQPLTDLSINYHDSMSGTFRQSLVFVRRVPRLSIIITY